MGVYISLSLSIGIFLGALLDGKKKLSEFLHIAFSQKRPNLGTFEIFPIIEFYKW